MGVDDCWLWKGPVQDSGYGRQRINHVTHSAHQVAWVLSVSDIPIDKCVCHKCDVRLCCNPNHLWLGTYAENNRDKAIKGRAVKGSECNLAKLSETDIISIIESLDTVTNIANKYKIHRTTVTRIRTGKRWKHMQAKK